MKQIPRLLIGAVAILCAPVEAHDAEGATGRYGGAAAVGVNGAVYRAPAPVVRGPALAPLPAGYIRAVPPGNRAVVTGAPTAPSSAAFTTARQSTAVKRFSSSCRKCCAPSIRR